MRWLNEKNSINCGSFYVTCKWCRCSEIYRFRLWLLCSGAYEQMKSNPTYYKDLLKLSKEVHSLYSNDIEKDLDRTNSNLLQENKKYKDMLRNVLI